MRKLPGRNRTDSDRIFMDEYVHDLAEAAAVLGYAYGDTVKLLKKINIPNHEVNVSGNADMRGRLGGRRLDVPTGVLPAQQPAAYDYGRPKDAEPSPVEYNIPAIVDTMTGALTVQGPGKVVALKPTIYISTKIMSDLGIEIVPEEDLFQYKGRKYAIVNSYPRMNILNSEAEIAYEIEESK